MKCYEKCVAESVQGEAHLLEIWDWVAVAFFPPEKGAVAELYEMCAVEVTSLLYEMYEIKSGQNNVEIVVLNCFINYIYKIEMIMETLWASLIFF